MASRTSLPNSLTSPVLQKSAEGVSFRVPPSGSRSDNASIRSAPLQSSAGRTQPTLFMPGSASATQVTPQSAGIPAPGNSNVDAAGNAPRNSTGGYGFTLMTIFVIVLIYMIVCAVLYMSNLNMVTDLVNGERVINKSKLTLWTFIIGSVLALLLIAAYRSFR